MATPALNSALRGTGEKAGSAGRPTPKIEELRDAWFDATDAGRRRRRSPRQMQMRAFETVPYIPTAQFIIPTAYRTNLKGVIVAPITCMWNVEKK